jgi:hypothetical protein
MLDLPSHDNLPGWAIGLMIVVALVAASRPKGEKVAYASAPADWTLGFILVIFLHVVGALPSLVHGREAAGNLFGFIWWSIWNILLVGAFSFLAGWAFSRLPRGTAWSIRIALWLMPLFYIGVHYLLHRP